MCQAAAGAEKKKQPWQQVIKWPGAPQEEHLQLGRKTLSRQVAIAPKVRKLLDEMQRRSRSSGE